MNKIELQYTDYGNKTDVYLCIINGKKYRLAVDFNQNIISNCYSISETLQADPAGIILVNNK